MIQNQIHVILTILWLEWNDSLKFQGALLLECMYLLEDLIQGKKIEKDKYNLKQKKDKYPQFSWHIEAK